ncbi:SURF1 family cytochrome oxidase biogenesis protein [Fodinibacter luteus]|uniref:SURF1 family cytochrome oxidase biogenesis protein n=1 Tax=Fodinibacter luteus TaxID=552064 RepID=UPI0031E6575D
MLRRLVTPRWLGALLLAALFAVACYHLGWWQYDRHLAKVERNERLDEHYRAAPVPLAQVLAPAGLDPDDEWTRVTATGRYVAGPVFVRNRTREGQAGLEVLWLLRPAGGGPDVVVDRGWVGASDEGARVLPEVPPAPGGDVEVTGWVRRGEASRGRDMPQGQVASLNVAEAGAALGAAAVLPGYLLLEGEVLPDGTAPPRPLPLGTPDRSLGPHLAYGYQWWLTMSVGFVLVWFGIRRELRAEDPEKYPRTPKKTRIWDEEDA